MRLLSAFLLSLMAMPAMAHQTSVTHAHYYEYGITVAVASVIAVSLLYCLYRLK